MEGPPIMLKPYTILLKYCEFMDHEIKLKCEQLGQPYISVSQKGTMWTPATIQVVVKMVNSTCSCVLTIENSAVGYKQHAK